MIPFLPKKKGPAGAEATEIALGLKGQPLRPLAGDSVEADSIVIDRGGFGVRIELDAPRRVQRGQNNTLLIALCNTPTPASQLALRYRLTPFAGP
jgi:hypothetical protein